MQLFIGNQNYSSWSLRAWLIFSHYQLDVQVTKLKLFTPEFYTALKDVTPSAKVPTLVDNTVTVWDSLAILEYVNEQYLQGKAWPSDPGERAKARAVAAEMHSSFFALRDELPMNIRAHRQVKLSEDAQKDIARIDALWSEQAKSHPNGWLFGEWSIADAMYAPVALRFETYGIALSPDAKAYQSRVLASKALQPWLAQAKEEHDVVIEDEAGESV